MFELLIFLGLALLLYARFVEPRMVRVSVHRVDLWGGGNLPSDEVSGLRRRVIWNGGRWPRAPKAAAGVEPGCSGPRGEAAGSLEAGKVSLRVVLLSDFHYHRRSVLGTGVLRLVEEVDPDLIFLAGDIIEDDGGIDLAAAELGRLRASHGVWAVLGNHDHAFYAPQDILKNNQVPAHANDIARLQRALDGVGIATLMNERVTLQVRGLRVDLVGVGDLVTGACDLKQAFDGFTPPVDHGVRIVLTHVGAAAARGFSDDRTVALAGHTHGGQIWIPWLSERLLQSRVNLDYLSGWRPLPRGGFVYVNRGIGHSHVVPFRFNASPEVAIFDLVGVPATQSARARGAGAALEKGSPLAPPVGDSSRSGRIGH